MVECKDVRKSDVGLQVDCQTVKLPFKRQEFKYYILYTVYYIQNRDLSFNFHKFSTNRFHKWRELLRPLRAVLVNCFGLGSNESFTLVLCVLELVESKRSRKELSDGSTGQNHHGKGFNKKMKDRLSFLLASES